MAFTLSNTLDYVDVEVDFNELWREVVGYKTWLRSLHS